MVISSQLFQNKATCYAIHSPQNNQYYEVDPSGQPTQVGIRACRKNLTSTRVLDREETMDRILSYLPLESADALYQIRNRRIRNAVLGAIFGAQNPQLPSRLCQLIFNTGVLFTTARTFSTENETTTARTFSTENETTTTRTFSTENETIARIFHWILRSKPVGPRPYSVKFCKHMNLSDAAITLLQELQVKPIEEVLLQIAGGPRQKEIDFDCTKKQDLEFLQGMLMALQQTDPDLQHPVFTHVISLLKRKAHEALITAAQNNNFEAITRLPQIDGIEIASQRGLDQPLKIAATHNNSAAIARLLQIQIVGGVSQEGLDAALLLAVEFNSQEAIDLLIAGGVSQRGLDEALKQAVRFCNHPEVIACLLQTPVVGGVSQRGLDEALLYAVSSNNPTNTIRLLLQAQIAGGVSQKGLDKALCRAVRENHLEAIDLLLQTQIAGGVSREGLDDALRQAASHSSLNAIGLLLQTQIAGGVSREGLDRALLYAADSNNPTNTIRLLLQTHKSQEEFHKSV